MRRFKVLDIVAKEPLRDEFMQLCVILCLVLLEDRGVNRQVLTDEADVGGLDELVDVEPLLDLLLQVDEDVVVRDVVAYLAEYAGQHLDVQEISWLLVE